MTLKNTDDWDELIPYYMYYYNSTPHTSTKYSPFELVFGKLCALPNDIIRAKEKVYDIDNYMNELKIKLKYAHDNAAINLNESKLRARQKQSKVNKANFKVNDYVYLKACNKKKLDLPFEGPYKIIRQDGPNSTILKNKKR